MINDLKTAYEHIQNEMVVLVIGGNHCWGKGATLEEARRNAWFPKHYAAYLAHPDTRVHEVDGSIYYPAGCKPRLISKKVGRQLRPKGEEDGTV